MNLNNTPENLIKFLTMMIKAFLLKSKQNKQIMEQNLTINLFTMKKICPFDKTLMMNEIKHKLILPRTSWQNSKAERRHKNDRRYFYDLEIFRSVDD